jgi:hypothetical protein
MEVMKTYIVLTNDSRHMLEAELVTLEPGLLVASAIIPTEFPLGRFSVNLLLRNGTNSINITCSNWAFEVQEDLKIELPVELPPEMFKIINVGQISDLKDMELFRKLKEEEPKLYPVKSSPPKESYLKRMYKRIRKGRN